MKKRWAHLATRLVTALAVVLLLVSTGATTSLRTAKSDIDENAQLGFLRWWHENDRQRGPKWITRNLIVGEPIEVCSEKFPLATAEAVARWNNALKITAFVLLGDHTACDTNHRRWVPRDGIVSLTVSLGDGPTTLEGGETVYQGLVVGRGGDIDLRMECNATRSFGCASFDHARALPGRDNEWHTYYGRAEIVMNPNPYSADSRWWENLIRDIAHELGHILALRDYFCHIPGSPTDVSKNPDRIKPPTALMDTRTLMNSFTARTVCNSPDGRPTKLDLDDYVKIYTPAIVTRVRGEADGQVVTLHWNQANVFVESDFEIQRKNGAIWEMEEIADANTESITLTNQPIGEQLYRIRARTLALCPAGEDCRQMRKHVYGGSAEITVSVPPPAPTGPTVTARTPVSLTVSWTVGVGASFHEVKATTRANCNEKSETYETPSSNSATSHPLTDLTPNTPYRLCVRSVRTIGSDSFRSAWAETPETMTTAKLAVPSTRSISDSDITTNTITLRWSAVADADGYEVKATKRANCNLESETYGTPNPKNATSHRFPRLTSNTSYRLCVRATLDAHSAAKSAWASRSAKTATPPPTPDPDPDPDPPPRSIVDCLSNPVLDEFTTWLNNGSQCGTSTASLLWAALVDRNIAIGCIRKWDLSSRGRVGYESGGTDFDIPIGIVLFLRTSACPPDGAAAGSADAGAPSCADAVKPASGAAVVSVGSAACSIVRGGGAVEVSDGTGTLSLTLSAERDWLALAAPHSAESDDDAFWLIDLSTGGWLALNPADAAELARHAPADADGLPALLDAIAASASVPE